MLKIIFLIQKIRPFKIKHQSKHTNFQKRLRPSRSANTEDAQRLGEANDHRLECEVHAEKVSISSV
jgi:hypothetical protein